MDRTDCVAQLFVDGYNMIGAWPGLMSTRQQDGFDAARRELIELLANYSARKGLDTQVVFDAHGVRTPTAQEVITHNLSVCYTAFGQTADTYIERVCAQLRHKPGKPQRVIVATSDRAHQLTVVGYGAEWMSARQLEQDIYYTHRQAQPRGQQRLPRVSRSLLSSMNDDVKEKLTKLRFGIH
ncbi:MAG TPA: NYN domain-containing protein [Nodosilinea sp.]|nr:NYN domain-containing protein [Nodosilinea sp.]